MTSEAHRIFLVRDAAFPAGARMDGTAITLGWLSIDPEVWVRRTESPVDGRRAYTNQDPHADAPTPLERQRRIEAYEANELLEKCETSIRKTRYRIKVKETLWDVDAYETIDGLWLATTELDRNASFEKPAWLEREVTDDSRYTDLALARVGHAPA